MPRSSTLDLGGFGAGRRQQCTVPHQRPQPRRHRVHRDREGAGGGHALRDSSLQRRRADHDQAGRGGQAPLESLLRGRVGQRRQQLSRSTSSGATTPRTGPDFRRLLHYPGRARRGLHPDLRRAVSHRSTTPPPGPYKAGLRQQYGANVSGGTEQLPPTTSPASTRTRSAPFRLPTVRGGLGPGRHGRRARDTRSGPTRWSG